LMTFPLHFFCPFSLTLLLFGIRITRMFTPRKCWPFNVVDFLGNRSEKQLRNRSSLVFSLCRSIVVRSFLFWSECHLERQNEENSSQQTRNHSGKSYEKWKIRSTQKWTFDVESSRPTI
jgi:hypothetical protein